jgi:hypothetical protein
MTQDFINKLKVVISRCVNSQEGEMLVRESGRKGAEVGVRAFLLKHQIGLKSPGLF